MKKMYIGITAHKITENISQPWVGSALENAGGYLFKTLNVVVKWSRKENKMYSKSENNFY